MEALWSVLAAPARVLRQAGGVLIVSSLLTLQANAAISINVSRFNGADRPLAAAVSETLSTELARSPGIMVVENREGPANAPARFNVVGSCLSLDGIVIINARIVDSRTGATIPGGGSRVTGPRSRVLTLVDGLAVRLAAHLTGRFTPTSSSGLSRFPGRETLATLQPPFDSERVPAISRSSLIDRDTRERRASDSVAALDRQEETSDAQYLDRPRHPRESPERYTGLIIDTRGFGVERSMSPRIRTEEGEVIWAGEEASPDFVIDRGIVAYARTMRDAEALDRAGDHPLILRAVGRHPDNFRSDPLVAREDAEYLASWASRDGFLKKFNVIFVTD